MSHHKLIDNFFTLNRYYLSKHHIDSYNDFLDNKIKRTVKSMNPFIILKKDIENPLIDKHTIEIYIGGTNGDELFIDKPIVTDSNSDRILLPNEARLNNLSYSVNLYANIVIIYTNHGQENPIIEKLDNVHIGSIPLMLHSKACYLHDMNDETLKEMGECIYDRGGYFLIDGKEKVIVSQERNSTNNLFISQVENDNKYSHKSFIHCYSEDSSVFSKTIHINILNSVKRRGAIVVRIPQIEHDIPLFILFRAIGIESDKEIINYIINSGNTVVNPDVLHPSIVDSNFIFDQQSAKLYLSKYTKLSTVENVDYILINNLFPNYTHKTDLIEFKEKALFLGNLVNKLVLVQLGLENPTDRDNYMYKRIGLSGFLLSDIFKDYYNEFRIKCRSTIDSLYEYGNWRGEEILEKRINNGNKQNVFQSGIISNGIKKSLKGSWGITGEQGIVQDLNRLSHMSTISHIRRVTSTMDSSIKIRHPHQLNTSQFGYMCPCESPDGANIGLIKSMSMLCHITFEINSSQIIDALKPFDIVSVNTVSQLISNGKKIDGYKIFINNNLYGICPNNGMKYVNYLRLLKRNAFINIFTSISFNVKLKEIYIYTDAGRCSRPLLIVNNGGISDNFSIINDNFYSIVKGKSISIKDFDIYKKDFIDPFKFFNKTKLDDVINILQKNSASVEFVDISETNNMYISMFPEKINQHHTHCEIHPSTMFSIYTSCIPFSNHNQAPRNIFSGAQGKQAVGIFATNFRNRIDTMGILMNYPEKPLLQTRFNKLVNMNDMPNGNNLIVAISTYMGYNQEDSIIFNKRSLERGLFNVSYTYSILSEEALNDDENIIISNAKSLLKNGENVKINSFANYDNIDDNGLPIINRYISEEDVVVGKCKVEFSNTSDNTDIFSKQYVKSYTSKPLIADKTTSGFVDKVFTFKNTDGQNNIKINMRKMKIPELGDKLASRHGQKGVIGMILSEEDMPRTSTGIIPDIIMNPHAFPSRMTIGHLLECIIAKGCLLSGESAELTPFDDNNVEDYFNILQKHGYDKYGNEILYNGINGEQMQTEIFFGPTYYYRLKHMVDDKINYRVPGKVLSMTRQPTKGRGNEGGLRVGEMETNCLLAHGISSFIKESFNERSDKYSFYIDNDTGDIANINKMKKFYNGHTNVSKVFTPYVYKLFTQELATMGIKSHFKTNIDNTEDIIEEENEDDIEFESEEETI